MKRYHVVLLLFVALHSLAVVIASRPSFRGATLAYTDPGVPGPQTITATVNLTSSFVEPFRVRLRVDNDFYTSPILVPTSNVVQYAFNGFPVSLPGAHNIEFAATRDDAGCGGSGQTYEFKLDGNLQIVPVPGTPTAIANPAVTPNPGVSGITDPTFSAYCSDGN